MEWEHDFEFYIESLLIELQANPWEFYSAYYRKVSGMPQFLLDLWISFQKANVKWKWNEFICTPIAKEKLLVHTQPFILQEKHWQGKL